jgi:hypothetical protein
VSPLGIRRYATRVRYRPRVLVAALLVALSIVAHHTAIGSFQDAHHRMDLGAVADLCLGVFTAVGATVAAVGVALVSRTRWRPMDTAGPLRLVAMPRTPAPRVRAGPELLLVLCVSRC